MRIENMVDLRRYLNKLGYIIYTGDPLSDIDLIREEVLELFQAKILDQEIFSQLMMVLSTEEKKLR